MIFLPTLRPLRVSHALTVPYHCISFTFHPPKDLLGHFFSFVSISPIKCFFFYIFSYFLFSVVILTVLICLVDHPGHGNLILFLPLGTQSAYSRAITVIMEYCKVINIIEYYVNSLQIYICTANANYSQVTTASLVVVVLFFKLYLRKFRY